MRAIHVTAPELEATVRLSGAGITVSVRPGGDISVSGDRERDRIRLALRGQGAFTLRFEGMPVRDVDVRGGVIFVEPGAVFTVRGSVDGWLSVTVRTGG